MTKKHEKLKKAPNEEAHLHCVKELLQMDEEATG